MRMHRKPVTTVGVCKVQWVRLVFAIAQLGLLPSVGHAQSVTPSDAQTTSSAQAYCVGMASSSAKELSGLNHWQYGLANLDRYYKKDPKYPPRFWLQEAIGDFNYVIGHNPGSTHPLLADVHMQRAHVLTLSGQATAAWPDYVRTIQLDPNRAKAYIDLARSYAENGLKAEALETATNGLRCLPSNKLLQQAYVKYGGKLPYPAPAVRSQKVEPDKAEEPEPREEPPLTESDTAKAQDEQTVLERGCRFCPPDEIQQRWRESFQTGQ